ncbi:MAG: hypothetical protein AAGG79_06530 [Pseudomonadota bacterium]
MAIDATCVEGLHLFDFDVLPIFDGASLGEGHALFETAERIGTLSYAPDLR